MTTVSIAVVLVVGDGRAPSDLERALRALEKQVHAPDEVVIVLNGAPRSVIPSTTLDPRVVELDCDTGCSPGRNAGAAATSADVLLFSDDDGELAPNAVCAVVDALTHAPPDVAGVAGFIVPDRRVIDATRAIGRRPIFRFSGGVCAVRRDAFLEVGCWANSGGRGFGDELDLAIRFWRRGNAILTLPGFVLYHPPRKSEHSPELAVDNNSRLLRVYYEHYPLPYALAATAFKLIRDAPILAARRETSAIGSMVRACLTAAAGGWRVRQPLSWREFAALRNLDSAAPSTRISP